MQDPMQDPIVRQKHIFFGTISLVSSLAGGVAAIALGEHHPFGVAAFVFAPWLISMWVSGFVWDYYLSRLERR